MDLILFHKIWPLLIRETKSNPRDFDDSGFYIELCNLVKRYIDAFMICFWVNSTFVDILRSSRSQTIYYVMLVYIVYIKTRLYIGSSRVLINLYLILSRLRDLYLLIWLNNSVATWGGLGFVYELYMICILHMYSWPRKTCIDILDIFYFTWRRVIRVRCIEYTGHWF